MIGEFVRKSHHAITQQTAIAPMPGA